MSCYAVASLEVHDRVLYDEYAKGFAKLFPQYLPYIRVIDENVAVIEGEWPFTRFVIIEFPTRAEAEAWYYSEEYQDLIKRTRLKAATGNLIFVESLPRR